MLNIADDAEQVGDEIAQVLQACSSAKVPCSRKTTSGCREHLTVMVGGTVDSSYFSRCPPRAFELAVTTASAASPALSTACDSVHICLAPSRKTPTTCMLAQQ